MKVGIEAQRLFRKHKHGLEIVALEIIKSLQIIDKTNSFVVFVRRDIDSDCITATKNLKIVEIPANSFPEWEQVKLPKAISKEEIDIIHCTANTAPLFVNKPMILTLHDIIFMEHDKFKGNYYQYLGNLYRKLILPHILKKCVKILTVSKSEKKLILDKFRIDEKKVDVLYNAVNKDFYKKNEDQVTLIKKKYSLPDKFILFFGNSAPKKNTRQTILGYLEYLKQSNNGIPLVIAGAFDDYVSQELNHLHLDNSIRRKIIVISYIPFSEQPDLYSAATLFLYTSIRESFGMPILESMACGTPVITSSFSSMPEIAGNAALLVNSRDKASIADGIQKVLENNKLYEHLVSLGVKRSSEFSWENSTKKLIRIYEEVFNSTSK